jgi:hypothetical protein
LSRRCKICSKVKESDIQYINEHVEKGDLSYADLTAFLNTNYSAHAPWYPSGIGMHRKHMNRLNSPELIEQAAEAGKTIPDTIFTEQDQIGSALSHMKLIHEYWLNYQKIKDKPGNDMSKRNYLDSIAKEMETLAKLKVMERDWLTQLGILKEAREKDSPAQRADLIEGWSVPALLEKTKNNDEARFYIHKLIEYLSFVDTALGMEDKSLVVKKAMEQLYDKQRGVIFNAA